ncbi:MAG TPA: hypothetical protein VJ810_36590 [Blastocatellia bacterium]|nr:hypothetical protein [Blastocatellia bacterium]
MEEVGHDLRVLHVWADSDGFVVRSRLFDALKAKASFDQQIQPLAHGSCEAGCLELRQSLLRLRRRSSEELL